MEIVVADDDFVARGMLTKMLEKLGHSVLPAENGRQAWESIQERHARMVITDWEMPEMDGLELCRRIRQDQNHGYIFVFLLTAKDEKENLIRGLEAGADDYLSKPFHQAEFVARLNTGLRILDLETSLQEANEEIRLLSLTDSLTGCFNKRYLAEMLPKEIRRLRRFKHPLSVAICDIDHFKTINDSYGHPAGDSVLKAFAGRIQASIRSDVDWLVRYGGEEFVVILPETRLEQAAVIGERLREAIGGTPFRVGEKALRITASFGLTGFEAATADESVSPEKLIEHADTLLYRSKRDGRNRITREGL